MKMSSTFILFLVLFPVVPVYAQEPDNIGSGLYELVTQIGYTIRTASSQFYDWWCEINQPYIDEIENAMEFYFPLPSLPEYVPYDPLCCSDIWDDPSGYFGQTMQEGYGAPEFPIAALVLPLALIPIILISRVRSIT
jgi:hypothetical protein